ncbi:MAG: winged helix-turn-helix transcriptional regulator [Cytophagaceae bacterium]
MGDFKINEKTYHCPVELTLSTIGGKWKILIIWNLQGGLKRYGELRKLLPEVTHKMLTQQLRELEEDGIIQRKVYQVVPPKVEYSLTERGERLEPIVKMMQEWGLEFLVKNSEQVEV